MSSHQGATVAMDPFSALSLARNVIHFVDFGTRVVSASFELYSPDGISTNVELESIMHDLTGICAGLEQPEDSIDEQVASKPELDLITSRLIMQNPCRGTFVCIA